jgi:hypothetical protein
MICLNQHRVIQSLATQLRIFEEVPGSQPILLPRIKKGDSKALLSINKNTK